MRRRGPPRQSDACRESCRLGVKFMKLKFAYRSLYSLVLIIAGAALPGVAAQDAAAINRSAPAAQGSRPPLALKIDPKPIDRNAPERVSYAPIVDQTQGNVVFVYSTRQVRAQDISPLLDDPIFRRFFGVPEGSRGQGLEETQRGLGSGVVVSREGYIITNNHVVAEADDVKVSIGDSLQRYDATIVGTDALADIAVLKIEASDLQPATLGDSDQLKVGDVVLAIGNPFGVGQSVSRGIVSAVGRGNLGIEQIEDFIQTDAAINMGNSGGALIDSSGRVVGINTAIVSRSGGFAGVGFAIPINLVRNIAEQIVKTGEVTRGFLGVAPQALTPELAAQFGTHRGALVAEVTPESAAEKSGLKSGDIITKVNELEILDPRQLLLAVSQLAPGSSAKIEYLRDGKTMTATAQLERRPGETTAGRLGDPRHDGGEGLLSGVAVSDLTPQLRAQLQIPSRVRGAVITRVDPMGAPGRQGLREGDVILELNRQPVQSAQDVTQISRELQGDSVMALIWRGGRTQFVVIERSPRGPTGR